MKISSFKLILGSDEFTIPSNFSSLKDIDQDIYYTLIVSRRYSVKSTVSKEVFQSFLDNWVNKEIPIICPDNFPEFSQLSQEFDRMKDLLNIFEKNIKRNSSPSLLNKQYELKKAYLQKKQELSQHINIYQQNNTLLLSNPSNNLYKKLHDHICSYSVEENNDSTFFTELLSSHLIEIKSNHIFTLNLREKTAGFLISMTKQSSIFVPKSILYDSHEYIITSIHPYCFNCLSGLKNIRFPEDSEIRTFGRHSFIGTELESITFPSHTTHIGEHAFSLCQKLEKVEFLTKSDTTITFDRKCFQHSGVERISLSSGEIIIGKKAFQYCKIVHLSMSAKKITIGELAFEYCSKLEKLEVSEETENIVIGNDAFCHSSIGSISVLAKNTHIGVGAFSSCEKLEKIEFSEKSDSLCIENFSLSSTPIESIVLPSKETRICKRSLYNCQHLRKVVISGESVSIESCSFRDSPVEELSIHSKEIKLDGGWCSGMNKLGTFDISLNKGEKYWFYNNDFLVEKSDPKSDNYDVLSFARRDIKDVLIPPFIRIIGEDSFHGCKCIEKVEFAPDSKLEVINSYAFFRSSIKSVILPDSVTEIKKLAFFNCEDLVSIEFSKFSKLKVIEKEAFYNCPLKKLSIPSGVQKLEEGFCSDLKNLNDVTMIHNDVENVKIYKNDYVVGKSDTKSDVFDVLYLAKRNAPFSAIPSHIKTIANNAFQCCEHLKCVDLPYDSEVERFGKLAFAKSPLSQIYFPKNLETIEEGAFSGCRNIKIIEIDEESKLTCLKMELFYDSSSAVIMIPPKLKYIEKDYPKYMRRMFESDDSGDEFSLFG